jgi:hypothetical protein
MPAGWANPTSGFGPSTDPSWRVNVNTRTRLILRSMARMMGNLKSHVVDAAHFCGTLSSDFLLEATSVELSCFDLKIDGFLADFLLYSQRQIARVT